MSTILTLHLTERELAERWGLSIKALQAQRQRGVGPAYLKLGAAVRYRLADVEEFETAQTRQSTAQ